MPYLRHYSQRILNPFSGTVQIVEFNNTRAICTDGINWQLQILNDIVQKPWSELRVQGSSDQYLKYGIWSKSSGLDKIPVHPTLYQEDVEQQILSLINQLQILIPTLPFEAKDNYELWLLDPEHKPVVLIKSAVDNRHLVLPRQSHWYPFHLNDTSFKSELTKTNKHAQNMLSSIVLERLSAHPACVWIKRDDQRHGHIIACHPKRLRKSHSFIPNEHFPTLLISGNWDNNTTNSLVNDYISWQAPLLLTLDYLSDNTRKALENSAQLRPDVVDKFHRLYPKVIDTKLLNKILVEATMRKALS